MESEPASFCTEDIADKFRSPRILEAFVFQESRLGTSLGASAQRASTSLEAALHSAKPA